MTIQVLRSNERGHARHGWLESRHTFSFANYYHPDHMGFRALRVINEDRVAPGEGFGRHPHRDMEILSYVLEGSLAHRDSMGNGTTIVPGDVQRMTAGSGVAHSEMNASNDEPVHFLQIWIVPEQKNLTPGYEQIHFSNEEKRNRLRLVASRDGRDGSVTVHQDVALYSSILERGEKVTHVVGAERHAWVQIVRGEATFDGTRLSSGDAAWTSGPGSLVIEADATTELLVFDLG